MSASGSPTVPMSAREREAQVPELAAALQADAATNPQHLNAYSKAMEEAKADGMAFI